MRNLSLIIALISVFSLGVNAQSTSIGLRGGVNLTSIANEDTDFESVIGMNFAIPVEIGITELFSVQPELHYVQKGGKFDFTNDITVQTLSNYIELPILAKANFGSETFKGYVVAGPSVGLAFSRYVTTTVGDTETREKAERDTEGERTDNIIDFGIVGGVGAQVAAGPGAFVIDVRYNLDLNDSSSFENGAPDGWNKSTNTGTAITIGYMYNF